MYQHFFKRVFDIVGALMILPFVILVVIVLGPIIYFSDKGPIFYNASRVGKDFKEFKMYKLRSMKVNAPDIRNADGSTYNSDNDPRVTRIGHFMRQSSLDEFPQFLNVLRGDMSFIGPRPGTPEIFKEEITAIMRKHFTVKPGITGYTQAILRNSATKEQRYENDAFYVDHLSFILDIKIIVKTVVAVTLRKNIYKE